MRPRAGGVLVAYALLQWPWRKSLEDHLYSFRRYGRHTYHYVNLAVPGLALPYAAARYDAIVWHTSFLYWVHLQSRGPAARAARARPAVKDCASVRVALPQDEFLRSDTINAVLTELGGNHVFSVAPPSEWPKIYDGLDRGRVGLSRVLTGISTSTLWPGRGGSWPRARSGGSTSATTRPRKPYLGRHAILKAEIAEVIRERAEARGLRVDISTRAEDTFYGDDWDRFLASRRYTIGVEGGREHPRSRRLRSGRRRESAGGATGDRLRRAGGGLLSRPGRELALYAISPRHLQARATQTAQILVNVAYAGILRPGAHYVALRRDLSSLDEVMEEASAEDGAAELAERAYRDVVASGGYTYRRLVEQVEPELPASAGGRPRRRAALLSGTVDALARPLIPLVTVP